MFINTDLCVQIMITQVNTFIVQAGVSTNRRRRETSKWTGLWKYPSNSRQCFGGELLLFYNFKMHNLSPIWKNPVQVCSPR